MGKRYLIDSNVIIDFCNGKLSEKARELIETIEPEISIITNIELFASTNISKKEYALLQQFTAITIIHPVNVDLVEPTIKIRQQYKIKLPDAIISATALTLGATLLTRNVADFHKIEYLDVVDPYTL